MRRSQASLRGDQVVPRDAHVVVPQPIPGMSLFQGATGRCGVVCRGPVMSMSYSILKAIPQPPSPLQRPYFTNLRSFSDIRKFDHTALAKTNAFETHP